MADTLDLGGVVMSIAVSGLSGFARDSATAGVAASSLGEIVTRTMAQFSAFNKIVGAAGLAITGYYTALGGIRQAAGGAISFLGTIGSAFKQAGEFAWGLVKLAVPGIASVKDALFGLASTVGGYLETALAPLRIISSFIGDLVGALGEMAAGAAKAFIGFGMVAANAAQQLVVFALDVQNIIDGTADLARALGTTSGEVNLLRSAFAGVGIEGQQMATIINRLTTQAMNEFTKSGENAVKTLDRQAAAQDAVSKANVSYRRTVEDATETLKKAQESYKQHAQTLDAQRALKASEAVYVKTVNRAYEDYQTALGGANEKMRIAGVEAEKLQGPLGRLGVQLTDQNGELKTAVPLFFEVARAIAAITNPTEQSARAIEVFGKNATKILPILKEGPEAVEKYRAEIDKLELNFTKLETDAAAKVESGMYRIRMAFEGVKVSIGAPLLNPLSVVLEKLVSFTSNTLAAARASGILAQIQQTLATPFQIAAGALTAADNAVSTFVQSIGSGPESTNNRGGPALSNVLTKTQGKASELSVFMGGPFGQSFVQVGSKVQLLGGTIDEHNKKIERAATVSKLAEVATEKFSDILRDVAGAFKEADKKGTGFSGMFDILMRKWSANSPIVARVTTVLEKIRSIVSGIDFNGLGRSFASMIDSIVQAAPALVSVAETIAKGMMVIVSSAMSAVAALARLAADMARARAAGVGNGTLGTGLGTNLSVPGAPSVYKTDGGSFVSSVGSSRPSSLSVGPQMSFAGNLNVYGGGGGGGMDPLEVASAVRAAKAMGAL